MEIIIKENYAEISKETAEIVRSALMKKPDLVLGLATGSTPIGLYAELIRMHREEDLDFSQVVTFNLDEYVGIPIDHPESYHTFMNDHFFDHINIPKKNQHIPQNTTENLDLFCEWYESQIRDVGGIDIQILGIGLDGHIGFNEPGSSLASRTRIKTLAKSTIKANARNFDGDLEAVPKLAITMGVGTIMDARNCVLMASGAEKASVISKAIEGPISAETPASILQMHPKTTFILDHSAASELKRIDYHRWVYENKIKLQQGKI